MELRWLGVAGWHLRVEGGALLLDPYLSRAPLWDVLTRPLTPAEALIERSMEAHRLHAGWILVSHPHYDHLADVPTFARLTRAEVATTPQGVDLLRVLGVERAQAIRPGDALTLGPFRVTAYPSAHRKVAGRVPYTGPLRENLRPPLHARDYRMDRQLSFLIEGGGVRVLALSGIDDEPTPPADVLLVGADMRPADLRATLAAVGPDLVLPTHWDDMFRPVEAPLRPLRLPRFPLWRIDMTAFRHVVEGAGARVQVPGLFGMCRV